MHRLVMVLFVFGVAGTLFGQEWREDKFVPMKEDIVSYDISRSGNILVAVSARGPAARFDLTAKAVKGKKVQPKATSVVFSPAPQGDFVVFGKPSNRYDAGGMKDVEFQLGDNNIVVNKAEGGSHFIVQGPGWFHVWSYSQRMNGFGFDPRHRIMLSHDGNRVVFWNGVRGSLIAYNGGFKHPSSSKSVPFPDLEWFWKLENPPAIVGLSASYDGQVVALALEDGAIYAHLESKVDTKRKEEMEAAGMPTYGGVPHVVDSLADAGAMEGMDKKGVTAIAVSPKGELIAAGQSLHPQSAGSDASKDSSHILVWQKGEAPTVVGVHKSPVVQLQFLDDSRLVSAVQDGEIGIWNLASGGSQLLPGHGVIKKFVLSVDRKTVVVLQTIKDKEDAFVVFKEEKAGSRPQLEKAVTAVPKK